MLKILVTNDDGIDSPRLAFLAEKAKKYGEVWVAAPNTQMSAMSHRITFSGLSGRKIADYPVSGVHAYSITGTPADCVRIAKGNIVPGGPDVVLSGVNDGFNCGGDVQYSGTVAAALEGAFYGYHAIALSEDWGDCHEVIETYLDDILGELLQKPLKRNEIWNVNFPTCPISELKGVLWNRTLSEKKFDIDIYDEEEQEDGSVVYHMRSEKDPVSEVGSDKEALLNQYISIGTLSRIKE